MARPMIYSLEEFCNNNKKYESLLDEFDLSRNEIKPNQIGSRDSNIKVWWHCKKHNYHWMAYTSQRTNPKCSGLAPCCSAKIATADDNFAVKFPDLLKDWDYNKNTKEPSEYKSFSHDTVYWKCHKCGHEWHTLLTSRTQDYIRFGECGCPKCSSRQSSFAERLIYEYMKQYFSNTQYRYRETGAEFDVYVPELRLAIEYDGVAWHKNRLDKHTKKLENANQNGIYLLNIMEYKIGYDKPLENYSENHNIIEFGVDNTYNISFSLVESLRTYINKYCGLNLQPVTKEFVDKVKSESYSTVKEDTSLFKKYPWLTAWYSKNNKQDITEISWGSSDEIELQCPNCGNIRKIKVHWIQKQFTGCSKCKCKEYIPIEHLARIKEQNAKAYQKRKDKLKEQRNVFK